MEYFEHPYWTGYKASRNGSVLGPKGPIKPILHHTGYNVITLRKTGKQSQARWHRFVWECIIGVIPCDKVVNHIDGIKTHNSIDNLELVTPKENTQHAYEIGLMKGSPGENNSMSKLSNEQALDVISMCLNGSSNKEIGIKYNLHPNYVSLIRHRRRWRSLWASLDK